MTIHWCGTGLSSIPGLRGLIQSGEDVTVWNRTVETAQAALGDITDRIVAFDADALADALSPEDIVVSMLPADWHVPLARLAIAKQAHFISSSYTAPEMRALDAEAKLAGSCLVNEVGLDPGIDHLMAHWLVRDYRQSDTFKPTNVLSFVSYCGGVPKVPNAFRYKFSWSPLGVLKALRSPSRSIRAYSELVVHQPWDAISRYTAPLPVAETFEVYPNRDSLPFIEEYGLSPGWPIKTFVRGTLRLNGWADAWSDLFDEIGTLEGPDGEARLAEISRDLWTRHAYGDDEPDRVILCVGLEAEDGGRPVYDKTYVLDAYGDARGSAMARLVSGTVALAVRAVAARAIRPGVTGAPSDPALVLPWLAETDTQAQHMNVVDHLRR